ncbi:MAG: DUF1983 domain-containing protein, partial [Kordiimonadaceae bacterium]|nr:DUF1983 domain-containing protein [Kordiimonadaceae bacterium]
PYIADGTETDFEMGVGAGTVLNVNAYIDGIRQKTDDYYMHMQSVRFKTPPPAGAEVVLYWLAPPSSITPGIPVDWDLLLNYPGDEAVLNTAIIAAHIEGVLDEALDTSTVIENINADITANVDQLTQFSSTVGENTSSIAEVIDTQDGLSAQYTLKVNVNGHISGFGLASTATNGVVISEFAVLADKFLIASPNGGDPVAAFYVTPDSETYISEAFIKDLTAAKLRAGTAFVDLLYLGGANFKLHGSQYGTDKGTMTVSDGATDLIKMGYLSGTTVGFEFKNASGEELFSAKTAITEIHNAQAVALLVKNPSFEYGRTGWQWGENWDIIEDPANAKSGRWVAVHIAGDPTPPDPTHTFGGGTIGSATPVISSADKMPNEEVFSFGDGEKILIQSSVKAESGASGLLFIRIIWYTQDNVAISESQSSPVIPVTNWIRIRKVFTAPGGARKGRLEIAVRDHTTGGRWFVDHIQSGIVPIEADFDVINAINAPAEGGATAGATWGNDVTGQPSDQALLNNQQQWEEVGGAGRPADGADITNYSDNRVSNSVISIAADGTGTYFDGTNTINLGVVTIGGLGYTGDLNADQTDYDDSRVSNANLIANADGTFSYFNGTSFVNLGAVTITGLGYTGDLNANRITNTNEITDGAGHGDTALWQGVTGTGLPEDNATVGAPSGTLIGGEDVDKIVGGALNARPTMVLDLNTLTSGAYNSGEATVFGVNEDGQRDKDLNGFFYWQGSKITIPRGEVGTSTIATQVANRRGYLVWDSGAPFYISGAWRKAAFAFVNDAGDWTYDNNSASSGASFIPSTNTIALGWLETGAADNLLGGGLFGAPATLTAVVLRITPANAGVYIASAAIDGAYIKELTVEAIHVSNRSLTSTTLKSKSVQQYMALNTSWQDVSLLTHSANFPGSSDVIISGSFVCLARVRDSSKFSVSVRLIADGVLVEPELPKVGGKGDMDINSDPEDWYFTAPFSFKFQGPGTETTYKIQLAIAYPTEGAPNFDYPDQLRVTAGSMLIMENIK